MARQPRAATLAIVSLVCTRKLFRLVGAAWRRALPQAPGVAQPPALLARLPAHLVEAHVERVRGGPPARRKRAQ